MVSISSSYGAFVGFHVVVANWASCDRCGHSSRRISRVAHKRERRVETAADLWAYFGLAAFNQGHLDCKNAVGRTPDRFRIGRGGRRLFFLMSFQYKFIKPGACECPSPNAPPLTTWCQDRPRSAKLVHRRSWTDLFVCLFFWPCSFQESESTEASFYECAHLGLLSLAPN